MGVRACNAAVGGGHSLVVTEAGALFSFGNSRQLGHGDSSDERRSPKKVDTLSHVRIVAAAAGSNSSMALADDGTVFSWGDNAYPTVSSYAALPRKVDTLSGVDVCAIALACYTIFAVTAGGELYTWGDTHVDEQGLLGHGNEVEQVTPKRVDALHDPLVCAGATGLHHTVAVTRDGLVFGWGNADSLGMSAAIDAERLDLCILPVRYPAICCARVSGL